ncbi:MAG: hypothetical protein NT069_14595 [Planctomycetota bacterium]|nr:hypothetical protein [Planctomycetota bacterium]
MSSDDRKPCPVCGEAIAASARKCRFCGEEFDADKEEKGDSTGGLIPYKNAPALIAYYCGLFSIFPCFPLGWVAFIMGIKGLKKVKEEPQVRGTVHAWIGVIMGGLFGLIWTLGTIGTIAILFFGLASRP